MRTKLPHFLVQVSQNNLQRIADAYIIAVQFNAHTSEVYNLGRKISILLSGNTSSEAEKLLSFSRNSFLVSAKQNTAI